jgi:ankyrin repeat protein
VRGAEISRLAALSFVVNAGRIVEVVALLDGGAHLNQQDAKRRTALMDAARYGNLEIVQALLKGIGNVLQKVRGDIAWMGAKADGHREEAGACDPQLRV